MGKYAVISGGATSHGGKASSASSCVEIAGKMNKEHRRKNRVSAVCRE